jgi:Swi5.
VGHHIHLLHEYNEVKDAARGFMGLIADARGVRQVEVEKEFGVEEGD